MPIPVPWAATLMDRLASHLFLIQVMHLMIQTTGLTPPHTTPLGKEGHLENVEVYGGVKTMTELST